MAVLAVHRLAGDNGDGITTSTDDIARHELNGSHYDFGRWSHDDAVYWNGSVTATSNSGHAGGSFGCKTGTFDCSGPGKPANAYARDTMSGRARVPVQIGCAVLRPRFRPDRLRRTLTARLCGAGLVRPGRPRGMYRSVRPCSTDQIRLLTR
ncbi:hypothetical protein [Nonomuraea sp. NPDC049141]|uniref:hypothetical protein n=1 Tax=Nonomuraea sp. NPDC049141 TaxID=3155500 RepID=UPI00340898CF